MIIRKYNYFILLVLIIVVDDAMPKKEALKEYRAKRNLKRTPEPSGKKRIKKKFPGPLFVIQKHDASHLHYDFRLEIGGVMPSWAIPKGPSTNPAIKRLAIQTEDHPLDYAYFEGIIPEGNYGAGTVMVWDIGWYENIRSKSMKECMKEGKIEVFLHGQKLQGVYVLIRRSMSSDDSSKKQWLFFKMHDEYADARRNPVKTQAKSALTKRTLKQIETDGVMYKG